MHYAKLLLALAGFASTVSSLAIPVTGNVAYARDVAEPDGYAGAGGKFKTYKNSFER
jgi:hypothetical protein